MNLFDVLAWLQAAETVMNTSNSTIPNRPSLEFLFLKKLVLLLMELR